MNYYNLTENLTIRTMRRILLTILIIILNLSIQAQDNKSKFSNRFDDVFEEEENENLTLRFFDALTGEPINGATVTVQNMEPIETDSEGKARFPIPKDDGILKVHFECAGYITSDFKAEVVAGTFFFNRFSVSPMLDLKDVRIVLDWDQSPADLDAHFVKENGYHISYRNTRILADGSGELDLDDMDGYGPETITIRNIDDLATYNFIVHDYTNRSNPSSSSLSRSKANVKVYGEGKLLYIFQIPQGNKGNKWSVFQIKEGQFIEINRFF